MLIEHASQFYRCIVPIVPWIAFIQNNEQGGQWFAYFLLLIYIIFKVGLPSSRTICLSLTNVSSARVEAGL